MSGFFRNGTFYGGTVPNGGTTGQALLKRTNTNGDVAWGDVTGVTFTYIVGSTPFASDWLSLTPSGTALTPDPKFVYLILTEGEYYHNFVRWDSTNNVYLIISAGGASGGGGAIFSYIDATKTAFDDDWLVDGDNTTITPEEGLLYLVLTSGEFENALFRFDDTLDKYILVYQDLHFSTMPAATAFYAGVVAQFTGTTTSTYTHGYFYECVENSGTYSWVNRKVQDGEKVQASVMPAASADLVGSVYQYIGSTDANYTHGYFYECIGNSGTYSWRQVIVQDERIIQVSTMPTASAVILGRVYQYIGATTVDFTHGYFYECVNYDGYGWENIEVQPGAQIQVDAFPTASDAYVDYIYQYNGPTNANYTNGYFYKCVENTSTTPSTYSWVAISVQDGGAGHEIHSGSTALTQRGVLNFVDFDVSDDSTAEETVVEPHLLTSAELSEIFSALPASNPNLYTIYDERGTELEVGMMYKSDGTTAVVYEKWLEISVPSAAVSTLTESLESIGAQVDMFLDVRGMVYVDGWATNLVWGVPNLAANGMLLSAYADADTSGNANSAGILYNGDVTSFDRIVVIVRYTKVAE